MAYNRRKRKVKKNIPEAEAHIHATYNNTIVSICEKNGNVISESELMRFVKTTPKYLSKFTFPYGLTRINPMLGIGTLIGGLSASIILSLKEEKNSVETRIKLDSIKDLLQSNIEKMKENLKQKEIVG